MEESPIDAHFLLHAIKTYLEGGQSSEVREFIKDSDNNEKFREIAYDLMGVFTLYIDQFSYETSQGVYEASLQGIQLLTQIGKPKEMFLALLEQADTFNDDTKYLNLLPPIKECLFKIGDKKAPSVAVAMETLYAHIQALDLPETDLEGEERKLLYIDPKVKRVIDLTNALIAFTEPFCEEVQSLRESGDIEKSVKLSKELTRYVIKLLHHPLSGLDLSKQDNETESDCYMMAVYVMNMMNKLHVDLHKCVKDIEQENTEIKKAVHDEDYNLTEPHSELSISMLVYCVYHHHLATDNIPHVFTPLCVYEFSYKYAMCLLKSDKNIVIHKGLLLLHSVLNRMPSQSLTSDYLESEYIKELVYVVCAVAVSCSDEVCRKMAVKFLPSLLDKFDMKGRHRFLKHLINSSNHSGIVGYSIQLLKEEIDQSKSDVFRGASLMDLLSCVFALPDGATTNILEQRERILGALNLLRYLLIKDKPSDNMTGIWNMVHDLEKSYCDPLRTGINMSCCEYQSELEKVRVNDVADDDDDKFTVSVQGMAMPGLTKEQREQFLSSGLVNLDMIDSVLGRVCELMDAKQKAK